MWAVTAQKAQPTARQIRVVPAQTKSSRPLTKLPSANQIPARIQCPPAEMYRRSQKREEG
jgi:hypothetical protein